MLLVLTGFSGALLISMVVFHLKALNKSGTIAATIIGTIIFGLGGWHWAIILLGFFISSSLLSKLLRKRKASLSDKFSKGSRRDAGQVLANGSIGALLVVFHYIYPNHFWVWPAFLGSFAAVNADTWATELGVLSKKNPRLITSGKVVEQGTSGGITLLGTLSALGGASFIALIGVLIWPVKEVAIISSANLARFLLIALAGLLGSMVDSWLGATVQAIYHCHTCDKDTEQHPIHHCGTSTTPVRGLKWFNNDLVNTLCAITGTLVTIALITIL